MSSVQQEPNPKPQVADSATIVGDVLDLRAFCLVVDLGSITLAAKKLRESKATLSRRISRLEGAIGVSLVKRSSRLVEATEDGAVYRERVGNVLELLGAANDEARHALKTPSGTLRITAGHEFNSVLAPIVVAFAQRFPDVKIDMLVTQAVLDFDRDGVDVALRVGRKLSDSSLITHKIMELDPVIVAAPEYVRSKPVVRSPADLTRHRVLSLSPANPHRLPIRHRTSGRESDLHLGTELISTDLNFLLELALAGGGIAVLPKVTVHRELADQRLVRLLADYEIPGAALFLLHRAARLVPPKIIAFREHVVQALRQMSTTEPPTLGPRL